MVVCVVTCPRAPRACPSTRAQGCKLPQVLSFTPSIWCQVFLTAGHLAIVMEYVNGGDMFNYVKRRGGLEEEEGVAALYPRTKTIQLVHLAKSAGRRTVRCMTQNATPGNTWQHLAQHMWSARLSVACSD